MNFFKLYIGDYERDTGHLSLAEDGAYGRLLRHCYASERPLPSDHEALYRIARAFSKAERAAVDSVMRQFFELSDDGYLNHRASKEIPEARKLIDTAKTNGRGGGRPKTKPTGLSNQNPVGYEKETQWVTENNPEGTQRQSSPDPEPKKRIKPTPLPPASPIGFAEFWEAYPKKCGKLQAEKAWRKLGHVNGLLPRIIEAVHLQSQSEAWMKDAGQFVPNPATWINGHRWKDENQAKSGPKPWEQ